jgi:hypothetical protein
LTAAVFVASGVRSLPAAEIATGENIQMAQVTKKQMTTMFKDLDQLRELGFQKDEHGQWLAPNCHVNVYEMDGKFQVLITLRTGLGIGFFAKTNDTVLTGTSTSKAQQQLV